jgi:hypothetical protein
VLESLVTGAVLPGRSEPLVVPDALELASGARVFLVDERDPEVLELPPSIRVVRGADLARAEGAGESAVVLEFLEPERLPGRIGVRLRVSRLHPDQRAIPVGEVVVSFNDADDLTTVEPTHVVAY